MTCAISGPVVLTRMAFASWVSGGPFGGAGLRAHTNGSERAGNTTGHHRPPDTRGDSSHTPRALMTWTRNKRPDIPAGNTRDAPHATG